MFIYVFYGLSLILTIASPETVLVPVFGDPMGYKLASFMYFGLAFLLIVFCGHIGEIGKKEFKMSKMALTVATMILAAMPIVKGLIIYAPYLQK